MIYDSEQEKAFILEAVKKYPTNYENALQLANAFGMSIQNGQVIPLNEQNKAFPPSTAGVAPDPTQTQNETPDPPGKNGNRKKRRSRAKTEKAKADATVN